MGGRNYSTSYGGSVQVLHKTLVSQNCLRNEKIALKKASMDRNWVLKYHYRKGIGLSNIIAGWRSLILVR